MKNNNLITKISAFIQGALHLHTNIHQFLVGFSGGVDSHVLLDLLISLKKHQHISQEILCVHVHHGLQTSADEFANHCKNICENYQIPIEIIVVNAQPQPGESPEAAARTARYHAFRQFMTPTTALLTAHHLDDQAETFLLQALRGSGVAGLAAMPVQTDFYEGYHLRPLLEVPRNELVEYAKHADLIWSEDPTNQENTFDRNYLRNSIMPLLYERWPSANTTLARTAKHAADAHEVLTEYAGDLLLNCYDKTDKTLLITVLKDYSSTQQHLILRAWLQQLNFPTPHTTHLHEIQKNVIDASEDAEPLMEFAKVQVRRYRHKLFAIPPQEKTTPPNPILWNTKTPLALPHQLGTLHASQTIGDAIIYHEQVTVRFRQGGERAHPHGRIGSHPLKKLLQEWGVPPWQRDNIPLIYVGDQLAVVVGYCVCEGFAAPPEAKGLKFSLAHDDN